MAEKEKPHEMFIFDRLDELEDLWVKESDDIEKIRKKINDSITVGIINLGIGCGMILDSKYPENILEVENTIKELIKDKETRTKLLQVMEIINLFIVLLKAFSHDLERLPRLSFKRRRVCVGRCGSVAKYIRENPVHPV